MHVCSCTCGIVRPPPPRTQESAKMFLTAGREDKKNTKERTFDIQEAFSFLKDIFQLLSLLVSSCSHQSQTDQRILCQRLNTDAAGSAATTTWGYKGPQKLRILFFFFKKKLVFPI